MKYLFLILLLVPSLITDKFFYYDPIDPIDDIIQQLIKCESEGKILAVNKKERHGYSYGILQFRLDTFNHFGERYDLPHDDILNPDQQKAIAYKMIEEGRIKHWACSKKI